MEMTLSLPSRRTRTGPPRDEEEPAQPGVDPFDVAWTLCVLIYMLSFAVRNSGAA